MVGPRHIIPLMILLLASGPVRAGLVNGMHVSVGGLDYWAQNAKRPWSLRIGGSPPCIERFEVRSGDVWYADILNQGGKQERSELSLDDPGSPSAYHTDVWTAYQFKIEPGPVSSAPWVVLGDWHALKEPGDAGLSSSWQLEMLKGDILAFNTQTSPDRPVRTNPPPNLVWKSTVPVTRGVWHSLVSRTVFDWRPGGPGAIDVWLDGAKIVNFRGPVGYNQALPPYFKFGIYRAKSPEPLAVAYANLALSRRPLRRRIAHPPEVCRPQ